MPSNSTKVSLAWRTLVEVVGTAFLLAAVVGSGIMGERLFSGSVGLTLLVNSLATGLALVALIAALESRSGAHLNPAVTLVEAMSGRRPWRELPFYVAGQCFGAFAGVAVAHGMFGEPVFSASHRVRGGPAGMLSEFVATFGLLLVIRGASRTLLPFAVGSYIAAGYWFTSSTSFANPAVTLARTATDTFTGIRPLDAPSFIVAQTLGAVAAGVFASWRAPRA